MNDMYYTDIITEMYCIIFHGCPYTTYLYVNGSTRLVCFMIIHSKTKIISNASLILFRRVKVCYTDCTVVSSLTTTVSSLL